MTTNSHKQYTCFIASPSDVKAERDVLDESFLTAKATEKISNMILVEPQDMDIYKINPDATEWIDPQTMEPRKPFDRARYFQEKTTPAAFILRNIETLKDFNGKYANSPAQRFVLQAVAKNMTFLKSQPNISDTCKAVINNIKNNKLNKISETAMMNLNAELNFAKTIKNGVNIQNLTSSLSQIASLKKAYDNRNIFAQIFYSNVRNQNTQVKNMINSLVANGLDRADVNNAVKAIIDGDMMKVNIAVDTISSKMVVLHMAVLVWDLIDCLCCFWICQQLRKQCTCSVVQIDLHHSFKEIL